MKSSDILLNLGKLLESNSELKTWSQANFSKDPTVYLGLDTENTPSEEDYPLIVVFYVERIRGESNRLSSYVAEIGAGIYKEELYFPDQTTYPKLKVYHGLLLVEDFRELVESVVFSAMPNLKAKVDVSGETTTEVYYPFFRSNVVMTLEYIRTSRSPLNRS